jgi:hypothetical protein
MTIPSRWGRCVEFAFAIEGCAVQAVLERRSSFIIQTYMVKFSRVRQRPNSAILGKKMRTPRNDGARETTPAASREKEAILGFHGTKRAEYEKQDERRIKQ